MVVLIDTNVIIDFLIKREPYEKAASEIIRKCAEKEMKGYLALHSVTNLWYILRKVPEEKRREWILDVCSFLRVAGVSHEEVVRAITMKDFKDFEDCIQDRCAGSVGAEYIVTRNTSDFANSQVPAVSPEKFLEILEGKA